MSGSDYFERQVRSFLAAAEAAPTRRDAEAYRRLAQLFGAQPGKVVRSVGAGL